MARKHPGPRRQTLSVARPNDPTASPNTAANDPPTTVEFRTLPFLTTTKATALLNALNKHDAAYTQQVEHIKLQLKNSQLAAQVKALRGLATEQQRIHEAEVAELKAQVAKLQREKDAAMDRHDCDMQEAREAFDGLERECRELVGQWEIVEKGVRDARDRRREMKERVMMAVIEGESDDEGEEEEDYGDWDVDSGSDAETIRV
ncbi:hypothetical protein EDC01DRAFT_780703 [Geopyxis carbonaria]|nr:hypothetical protein EDC01DRAFT_780703 [Geopyxis carbonaria]